MIEPIKRLPLPEFSKELKDTWLEKIKQNEWPDHNNFVGMRIVEAIFDEMSPEDYLYLKEKGYLPTDLSGISLENLGRIEPINTPLTTSQLDEINALLQIAQKKLGKMSNVSVESKVLEKFNVSDITNIETNKGEDVMEFIQQLMFKK